jgi:hypothetical protein
MADVISAKDVPQLLTLVAPGFFARVAYGWVLPRKADGELPTLVTSVALSLPLVALASYLAKKLSLRPDATELGYVALLLGLSLGTGYVAGRLRCWSKVRRVLLRLGHRSDPTASVLVRTVMEMDDSKGQVTINFKDGKRPLAGTPRFATEDPETAEQQLYVDHFMWWNLKERTWSQRKDRGGVLVRLDEVRSIELNREPK